MWSSLVLMIVKIIIGIVGNSNALLADAMHSLANVITSFAIFLSHKFGDRPADEDHPFGYGKVEFVIAAVVSLFIIGGTLFLVAEELMMLLYSHTRVHPHFSVIVVAIASVGVNEVLFHYLQCVGNKFNSATLKGNSWAIRADSFTSGAVIVSFIGVKMGFDHADGIMVLVVAMIIFWTCGKVLVENIRKLMDHSVTPDEMYQIKRCLQGVEGAKLLDIKAHYNGPKVWTHLKVKLPEETNVEEYNKLSMKLEKMVLRTNRTVERVFVNYSI